MLSDKALIRAYRAYDAEQKAAQARVAALSELKSEIANQLWAKDADRTQKEVAAMLGISDGRLSQILSKTNPAQSFESESDDWAIVDD